MKVDGQPNWPLVATALASLSSWLPDCNTRGEVLAALDQGLLLWRLQQINRQQLKQEAVRVLQVVLAAQGEKPNGARQPA